MKTCIIVNPNSGASEQGAALRQAVGAREDVVFRETRSSGEARTLAQEAVREGFETVVAAGGDGTINEVVNGLAPDFDRVRFGIIPLGTGNDLAGMLQIPTEPAAAFALLDGDHERRLDVIRVSGSDGTVYCVNVSAGGFSGQVDEALTDGMKEQWGPLAYLLGAINVLPNLTEYETSISWDDEPPQRIQALNVIVANGRTVAGGIRVSPRSNPEDGLLDVVVVKYAPTLALAGVGARLLTGSYLESDLVLHRRTRRVRVDSRPGMWFNVDGELHSNEPVTFEVVPHALRIVAGEGYAPEPK